MIADFFREDPGRFTRFQAETNGTLFNYSKHRVDGTGLRLLMDLARAADIEARRDALFSGEPVNFTEHRPALHMARQALARGFPPQPRHGTLHYKLNMGSERRLKTHLYLPNN
jgi:glucose-6-phosphate isomerase